MQFVKFPSIEQFRKVVKTVNDKSAFTGLDSDGNPTFDYNKPKPTITFTQTVKIHGTNAGIGLTKDGEFFQQSRNRLISVDNDNAGFANWCEEYPRKLYFIKWLSDVLHTKSTLATYKDNPIKQVTLFGEFAGKGIMKGVVVSEVEKSFFAFGLYFLHEDGTTTKNTTSLGRLSNTNLGIYNIFMFENKRVEINFSDTKEVINKIIEDTLSVEDECPVGKYFGVSGVGEGVVLLSECGNYIFKSKGEKHSVSKVKTMTSADTYDMTNIENFVSDVLTENRLKQGIDYLKEMGFDIDNTSTGEYIKWVQSDILKEEGDIIESKSLDIKKVNGFIAKKAKSYLFSL